MDGTLVTELFLYRNFLLKVGFSATVVKSYDFRFCYLYRILAAVC